MKRDAYGQLDVHSYPVKHPLGPAEPSTPWLIELCDRAGTFWVLCFDFDGKVNGVVDPELMEQAQDQCDALSRRLAELGIKHVVCQSSGTGGRHIWIALREGVDLGTVARMATAAKAHYKRLDSGMLKNVVTGGARPPLSPHRDGSRSMLLRGDLDDLLTPSTTAADLVALTELLEGQLPALTEHESAPSGPVDGAHRTHRRLSDAGVAHMATISGGDNPSWTGFMCLMSAAAAGWTFRDIEQAAKTAPGMEHYRTRGTGTPGRRRPRSKAEAQKRLEQQWATALKYTAMQATARTKRVQGAQVTAEDLAELEAIVSAIEDLRERFRVNPGRWGATEATSNHQSILLGLAYLTLRTGKPVVAASIRDLGPMVGLGRTTANNALLALAEAGYVEQVTPADGTNAAEWRLVSKFSTTSRTVRSQPLDNTSPPGTGQQYATRSAGELFSTRATLVAELEAQLADQRHDLFSRGGLGHLAGKLYALLAHHASLTVDSAARHLGVTTRHTITVLSRLRKHKLIVAHADGWARSKQDLRDRAAKAVGVFGALIDRVRRYQVEREVWIWWQSELVTMRTSPRMRPRRPHVSSRPLFDASKPGERVWPRYPRGADNRAEHRVARELVAAGYLNPESRWQYWGDAA